MLRLLSGADAVYRDRAVVCLVVSGTELLECADLRAEIAQLQKEIADHQADLNAAAPGERGAIGQMIKELREKARRVRLRYDTLGCRP